MTRKLTSEQIEEARARLAADEGLSIRRLAPEYGVDESTLRRALQKRHRHDGLSRDIDSDLIEVPVIVRDYTHLEELYVYPLGDVHIGSPAHLAGRWQEWLDYLEANPDTSMLGLGDFLNTAIIGSKSDVYAEEHPVQTAKWMLADQLEPIRERVDLLIPGNHEGRITRLTGEDPIYDVARILGVPYSPASAFVVYRVGDAEYVFYLRHGTGNGQSLNQLDKSAMAARADVYVTGHVHKIAVTADEFFDVEDPESGRPVRRRRYYVTSGAFLAYEKYAAERGYKPSRIGSPRIYLNGRRHEVHVSI